MSAPMGGIGNQYQDNWRTQPWQQSQSPIGQPWNPTSQNGDLGSWFSNMFNQPRRMPGPQNSPLWMQGQQSMDPVPVQSMSPTVDSNYLYNYGQMPPPKPAPPTPLPTAQLLQQQEQAVRNNPLQGTPYAWNQGD